jgi:hypothetical protein
MKITGSPQLKEVVKNQEYNIEYGTIKYGDNTLVNIKIENVEHVSVSRTCGCTTPTVELQPNGVMIAVSYDNKKLGTINQRVTERCTDSTGTQKIVVFNLKGNIIE